MLEELINKTIERIKTIEGEPHVFFSGGKDSTVLKHIFQYNNIPCKIVYMSTSFEDPVILEHMKTHHPDVEIIYPEIDIFTLIKQKLELPSADNMYCCKYLRIGKNFPKVKVTGRRSGEFKRRKLIVNFKDISPKGKNVRYNPLYDWTDEDILGYIEKYNLDICQSKDHGKLLNCLICPMYTPETKLKNIERFPEIGAKLKKCAEYCFENNKKLQEKFETSEDYWNYFINQYLKTSKRWLERHPEDIV